MSQTAPQFSGKRLRALRERAGLSHGQLAAEVTLRTEGETQTLAQAVGTWEDNVSPRANTLAALVAALNSHFSKQHRVSIDALFE